MALIGIKISKKIDADNFVKTQGYKIFRIRGDKKDNLPSEEQIKEKISQLLIGYNFVEIIM